MTDQPFRDDPADPQRPAAPPPPVPGGSVPTLAGFRTMDLPIPRVAYYVAGASAIVVFLAAFLPWFSVTVTLFGSLSQSGSGTDGPMLGVWTLLVSLAVLAALVLLVVRPDPRLWLALPIGGALIVVFTLVSLARIASGSGNLGVLKTAGIHVSSGIGLWLTLLGGVALLVAAFLAWRGRSQPPAR